MSLAVVADPELRERMRCLRIIADQTPVSALGAASWHELEQVFSDSREVGLVLYTHPLLGAPEDAIEQLLSRAPGAVLAVASDSDLPALAGLTKATRPIAEETLVAMARRLTAPAVPSQAEFVPVDFLQMICMSGSSHVLVLSQTEGDTGVIEVRAGEIWTAVDGLGVGEAAFARLLRPEMRARIGPPTRSSPKERTIWRDLHALLLESLRRIDEGRVAPPPPLSPAQLEAILCSAEGLAERVRQLKSEAQQFLLERSYQEAARVLNCLSELDPSSPLVRANRDQLRRLGYIK